MASELKALRILIVEDQFLLASELQDVVETAGARVIGPTKTAGARAALRNAALTGITIDGAILDVYIDLECSQVFARELHQCQVPIVVITGYEDEMLFRCLREFAHRSSRSSISMSWRWPSKRFERHTRELHA